VLLELSSFQLEIMPTFHPKAAAITNIHKNHEERYGSFDEYARAKGNIVLNMRQGDTLFLPSSNTDTNTGEESFNLTHMCQALNPKLKEHNLITYFPLDFPDYKNKIKMVGAHNRSNLHLAYLMLKKVFPQWEKNLDEALGEVLNEFYGVPFRIQEIFQENNEHTHQHEDWRVFNDAKSTNFLATQMAIKTLRQDFPEAKLQVIIGGKKRDDVLDWGPQWEDVFKDVHHLYLFGETAEFLENRMEKFGLKYKTSKHSTLEDVKKFWLTQKTKKEGKGILLFSPAFPSFDQFKDYVHRGETFTQLFSRQ
jgi:UDP-N-acetylmuramoylalanine--D-glutamate ligase